MGRQYFGTDGVRGRVGEAPITPELVMHLGAAAGQVLAESLRGRADRPQVLIGKDTRLSGYLLESALEAGFASAGVDALLCGPLPTPGVAYLTRALRLDAGVVISASHNPFEDNGIKFFGKNGGKLGDALEEQIEAQLNHQLEAGIQCAAPSELGRARRLDDAAGRYVEFCKSTVPHDLTLRGLHVVVDCANGAAYHTAPDVFHELGARVNAVANTPDGFNINAGVGATHPEHLREKVLQAHADIGIALDGDADRLIVVDGNGRIFNGDELLYVIAMDRHGVARIPGVVGTLMTNLAIENAFRAQTIEFARSKVGDRYVLEELQSRGWTLGGEGSGHLICLDRHTTGDGTVSALQVLAAMQRSGRSLAQLVEEISLYPQTLINVRVPKGFDWKAQPRVTTAAHDAEKILGLQGRVLIRPSGTEPVVRVMVEAADGEQARAVAEQIADAMRAAV